MPIRADIQNLKDEITQYRRLLHQNPQTSFEETFASDLIAEKLTAWSIPFVRGIGRTGIVATLEGSSIASGKSVGLRADMDALDITENANKEWVSRISGKMHGCGHDGHTAMLLGAAKYLCQNRNFNGRVHFIFQPAEETGDGAKAMIADGLFERFLCDSIYGLHNWPYLPLGKVEINMGAAMAHVDFFEVIVTGRGGHASKPHTCVDPIVIAAQIISTLQTVISRWKDPFDPAVLSVTNINGGTGAFNVLPERVVFSGTVRTYCSGLRSDIEQRLREISASVAESFGGTVHCTYRNVIDATINDRDSARFCSAVARGVVGNDNVNMEAPPSMGGEDFGSMLEHRPGAYIKIGQGVEDHSDHPCSRGLHSAFYDFNDDLIPIGMEYWVQLVEMALPLENKSLLDR